MAFTFLCLLLSNQLRAQTVDRIIAIVGEEIVLLSELESQYEFEKSKGTKDEGALRCQLFEQSLVEKLLLTRAKQDSIDVTVEDIYNEVDRLLEYYIERIYGSRKKLEEVYGMPYVQIREDLKPDIREKLLIDRMKGQLFSGITVTPKEVKKFFDAIPPSELPYISAQVEVNHLAIIPEASEKGKSITRKALTLIRDSIDNQLISFEEAAKRHSQDPGSAAKGGFLGEFGRGKMVPEFEGMVYQLEEGELSPVFESPYGFHIAFLHKRVGEIVTVSHILLQHKITREDEEHALKELNEVYKLILADSFSFEIAAQKYSDDEATKSCGGCFKDPATGDLKIALNSLQGDFYFAVDEMNEGEISKPSEWEQPNGKTAYHIIYLKRKIPPHMASLEQDWEKIREAAIQNKQAEALDKWIKKAVKNVSITLKDEDCAPLLKYWIQQ